MRYDSNLVFFRVLQLFLNVFLINKLLQDPLVRFGMKGDAILKIQNKDLRQFNFNIENFVMSKISWSNY